MTLNFIYDNLMYDLQSDDRIIYHGTIDYVSDHMGDCITMNRLQISDNQIPELTGFALEYKKAKLINPNLTVEQFYEMS